MRKDSRAADALPADISSLVGRQAETAEVRRLLSHARLITLTGPGGVGKTRLAVHVARTVRSAFPDGARLVPLAELSQPDLVASAVAAVLGPARSAIAGAGELVSLVGDQRLLLVLDNCEHLVEAVADLVSTLLSGCPNLHILATSRSVLGVDGEVRYQVPTLELPDSEAAVPPGVAVTYDGVALFLERAGRLNADIAAGRVDELAVVELCRRLDGLPLAIELAAAGSRWLSVETMLAQASGPLEKVTPASRTAPARHRSVRASLDYSLRLCSPEARTLWGRLSVFRGGATLPTLEAVCSGGDLAGPELLTALFELADKSLVVLSGSRYTMLETIRQYGAALLDESGQLAATQWAHLHYFAELARELHRGWFGPTQSGLLARANAEQSNLRAALEFSLAEPAGVAVGLGMASDLWPYWIGSGRPAEGRRWLARLLELDDGTALDRPAALWTSGFLSAVDEDIPAARRLLSECLATAEARGDLASAAHARCTLGVADCFEGRIDGAIEQLEAGIALEREVDVGSAYLADALINLGLACCYRGDLDRAHAVLEEASGLCAANGEELLLSWARVFLALEALLDGRVLEAAELAHESLARKRELENEQGMMWAIELLAWAALESGDARRAALLLSAREARARDVGPSFHGHPGMRERHAGYAARAREQLGDAEYAAAVARGRRLSLDDLVATALGEVRAPAAVGDSPLGDLPLTRREREIAELVATGKTNREIAEALVIAPRTVDTHVQNILTKLQFTSRSQVVALVAASRSS
ncbi:LuxR family transcriptional regulator [Nocardioides panacihumi]|uniref:LuxR family transcriptional regulator n=1 Tax=Nocardioides panacihumi TaxID=400774 RepID=A0ABN2QA88_9ACTN